MSLGAPGLLRHTAAKSRTRPLGPEPGSGIRSFGGRRLKHLVALGVTLFATWLLLSGIFEPLFIALGLISCAICVGIAQRMEVVDHESHPVHMSLFLPGYWLWLFKEIVLANIDVTKRILSPGLPIDPQLFRVKTTQGDELGKVIYANSITLTPGTVTVDIDDDEFVVHALSETTREDLETGEMDRRVTALEGRA